MADHDPPTSPNPGDNAGARERWGKQILKAFEALTWEVTDLKQTAQRSEGSLAKLGEKVGTIETNVTVIHQDIKTWKTINWLIVGFAVSLIVTMGTVGMNLVSGENAQTVKIDAISKALESTNLDAKQRTSDLQATVTTTNEAIHEFKRLLDGFENKSKDHDSKLNRIETFVVDLENSKGESLSEFMAQRSMITRSDLKKKEGDEKLVFTVKLPYTSLSPSKPPRPSATLSHPHDPRLDRLGFQIKVTGTTDNSLEVTIASDKLSIQAIAEFLDSNGIIPLDLTIRTPKAHEK
jgi:archaellum component FlaC